MKKIRKGTPGYIRSEQKRRLLMTLVLFALPLGLFIIGLVVTETRLNWLTFVAILGCLPASRSAVGMILILMQRPVSREVLEKTAEAAGNLTAAWELVFTTYEHNSPVQAVVVCGSQVVCYTPDDKTKPAGLEEHVRRILSANGFASMQVKVFQDLKAYCQRVAYLRDHQDKYREGIRFTPDERYPELSRDELIMHTLYAISL